MKGNEKDCICEKPNDKHKKYCDAYRLSEFFKKCVSSPLDVMWLCAKHHREEHTLLDWQKKLRRAGYKDSFLLGQLIEACGEGLGYDQMVHVSTYPKNKKAFAYIKINEIQEGSTPEEAVTKLWLELNKKH